MPARAPTSFVQFAPALLALHACVCTLPRCPSAHHPHHPAIPQDGSIASKNEERGRTIRARARAHGAAC